MFENDILESAMRERESSGFGGTLTYNKANYPICLGAITRGGSLGPGGFSNSADRIFAVRKSVLPAGTTFKPKERVTVMDALGKIYHLKIQEMGIEDLVYAWQLTGEALNQG